MGRLSPFTGLRPRIAALVLGGVLVLAAVMVQVSAHSVGGAYERTARSELTAIATTWEDGFDVSDLADPELMQQRVQRLQELNPNLIEIAVSWHMEVERALEELERGAGSQFDPLVAAALVELVRDGALLTDRTSARSRPA